MVEAFKPVDVYPCTVDEERWTWDTSIRCLFGHLCSGTISSHDKEMGLLKDDKLTSRKTPKRQRDGSSSQDYSGISTQEDEGPDQEHDQDVTLVEPTKPNRMTNRTYAVPEPQERLRKRSRTSQESVRDPVRYSTPQMTLSSSSTSSECPHSRQKCAEGSKKIDVSRKYALSNTLSSKRQRNDLRSSFEGWLKTPGSKPKWPTQGDVDPTLQLTSELTTAVFSSRKTINRESRDHSPSAKPLSKDKNTGKEYHCRWEMCNETFDLLPKLCQHVFQNHEPNGNTGPPSGYTCLWGMCSKPKAPIYHTKELWMNHLEKFHNLNGLRMPRKARCKKDRAPQTDTRVCHDLAFSPTADRADDTQNSYSDRQQDPAGTQARPISLSSQKTSSSATASSLSLQNHSNVDDQEITLDNEPAHESQDSHLSVSTSAFESQPLQDQQYTTDDHRSSTEMQLKDIKYRKEAYKAAKGTSGLAWGEVDMVSSSGGHGELEMEI